MFSGQQVLDMRSTNTYFKNCVTKQFQTYSYMCVPKQFQIFVIVLQNSSNLIPIILSQTSFKPCTFARSIIIPGVIHFNSFIMTIFLTLLYPLC